VDKQIKILIVEDHQLVAKLLLATLETNPDFHVLGIASDGEASLKMIADNIPDVILLDIDMPVMDGIRVLEEIRKNYEDLKVVMISNHSEGWLIKKSITKGANGYLTKFADSSELVESIYTVMDNKKYFCKTSLQFIQALGGKLEGEEADVSINGTGSEYDHNSFSARYQRLTKREKQILDLLLNDHSSKDISEILYLSIRTVETHRKNIFKKMESKSTVFMIKEAIESGMFQT